VGIPSPARKPWYVREVWPALAGLGLGVPASIFALVRELNAQASNNYQLAALALTSLSVASLGIVKLVQSLHKDAENDKKDSPNDLRGCLHVIHSTVAGHKKKPAPDDGWLRITVHSVVGDELEQSVAYVGATEANRGGSAGRRFSITTGIIGRAARSKKTSMVKRPPDMQFAEWQQWLVEHTGMTAGQAAETRADRFAFLGVPIQGPSQEVRAVLYLDSRDYDFFTEEAVSLIADGCVGLAEWIDEHYYRK
jgi:hypothetical protein